MRKTWWLTLVCLIVIGCLVEADMKSVQAVPAFARREQQPCQMCHFRVPELNPTGQAYLQRGLRLEKIGTPTPGSKDYPAAATSQELGVPLKVDWADYLSVMGHHDFAIQKGAKASLDAGAIDLWIAGPIDPHWTMVVDPSFDSSNGASDVDVAFGQYITNWAENFYSLRVGQTTPYATLFNGVGPAMPLSAPVALSTAPDTGTSWTPTSLMRGAELGSVSIQKWNVYVGAGQPRPDNDWLTGGANPPVQNGFQNHTDLYASAQKFIGETGDSLTAYGYWGHAWLSPTANDSAFHRYALIGNLYGGTQTKGELGYVTGKDDAADGQSLGNSGYFLLGEHLLTDRWAVYGRYDRYREDLDAGGSQTIDGPTLGATYWASTEVRLTLESQFLKQTGQSRGSGLTAEVMWIF